VINTWDGEHLRLTSGFGVDSSSVHVYSNPTAHATFRKDVSKRVGKLLGQAVLVYREHSIKKLGFFKPEKALEAADSSPRPPPSFRREMKVVLGIRVIA